LNWLTEEGTRDGFASEDVHPGSRVGKADQACLFHLKQFDFAQSSADVIGVAFQIARGCHAGIT